MYSVKYCRLPDLDRELYRQCYRLNQGNIGQMRDNLIIHKKDKNAFVFFILTPGESKILSWALVYLRQEIPKNRYYINIYTRKSHRRRGMGKSIVTRIKEILNIPLAYYSDNDTNIFWAVCVGDKLLRKEDGVENL